MPIKHSRIINVVEGEIYDANGWHVKLKCKINVKRQIRLNH